ncbi:MAG TPA: hypothetical protein VGC88_10495 [Terriglobales bacterium]|jgi:hypothetical protein
MRLAIAIWAVVLLTGAFLIIRYDATPAEAHTVAEHWPEHTALHLDKDRPVMIMAVHPECSCTRASLAELARMLPRMQSKAHVIVLLLGKHGNRYEDTVRDLGVDSVRDPEGVEAQRFGLTTSGELIIFSASGTRVYSGGITGARAHEGSNPGEDAALAAVLTQPHAPSAPVFGCSLHSKEK